MSWVILLLFWQHTQLLDLPAVKENPHTTAADIEQGRKLYGGRCAGCHGPTGDGGKGANLAVPMLSRATDDFSLYRVIRYGVPETEMPGFNMAPREIWQVAAFVRSLGRIANERVTGDPKRGYALLTGKAGCLSCHAIGLQGGTLGPALHDIGRRRSTSYLRDKLLDSAANLPEHYRMVKLTTSDGRKISGIRLNEDTWSIQLREPDGRIHSFRKEELTALHVERSTPMPSYKGVLQEREIGDIVAYLAGLRGDE